MIARELASVSAAWSTANATWALVLVGLVSAIAALVALTVARSESSPVLIVSAGPPRCADDGPGTVRVTNSGASTAFNIEVLAWPTDPAHGRGDWPQARYSLQALEPGGSVSVGWVTLDESGNARRLSAFLDVTVTYQRSTKSAVRCKRLAGVRSQTFSISQFATTISFETGPTMAERVRQSPVPPSGAEMRAYRQRHDGGAAEPGQSEAQP